MVWAFFYHSPLFWFCTLLYFGLAALTAVEIFMDGGSGQGVIYGFFLTTLLYVVGLVIVALIIAAVV